MPTSFKPSILLCRAPLIEVKLAVKVSNIINPEGDVEMYKSVPTNSRSLACEFAGNVHPCCHSIVPSGCLSPCRIPAPVDWPKPTFSPIVVTQRCVPFPVIVVTCPLTNPGRFRMVFWPVESRWSTRLYPEEPPA